MWSRNVDIGKTLNDKETQDKYVKWVLGLDRNTHIHTTGDKKKRVVDGGSKKSH